MSGRDADPDAGAAWKSRAERQKGKKKGHDQHTHATPRPTASQSLFLRLFGGISLGRLEKHPQLGVKLAKARNPLVPLAYLSNAYGAVATTAILCAMPLLGVLVASPVLGVNWTLIIPLAITPILAAILMYSWQMLKPDLEISSRQRNLEGNLPYALNFLAALASAGVVPTEMFGALGAQSAYGEVAREAAWIYRDTKVFSKDLVQAMQAAAKRSPSTQFEEFLQGSVNTVTSGGDLKTYLLGKSEQFTQENRRKQKQFLESLGVMAESYVVVAAAAPLFLIVILSVMTLLSKGTDPTFLLNLLALLALPVIHGSFVGVLRTMRSD